MKYLFILVLICTAFITKAQKYMLLDETISEPAVYTNNLSEMGKYRKYFPVEVKYLPQFLEVLQKIVNRLDEKSVTGNTKNFQVGCAQFSGRVFPLASGERIDYILTSDCEGIKVVMHLCDAKLTNANNAYFVKTWIKFIRSNIKRKVK
ncbi:MAG: hypothetical protein ABI366_11505 [Ginsengibacter sp.]